MDELTVFCEPLQQTHLQRPLLKMSPTAGDETSREGILRMEDAGTSEEDDDIDSQDSNTPIDHGHLARNCWINIIKKTVIFTWQTRYTNWTININYITVKWNNYLVGHQRTLATDLLCVRVRTGFSKFLVSHTEIWFSTNEASWWSLCGSTTSPYTAFVGVEFIILFESEIIII